MSVPVPSPDLRIRRAGDAHDEPDPEIVTTIPIRVPLHTIPEATASESPAPPLSDAELLAAFVQRRDADAFTEIVQRYRQMVYRVALRAVEDRHTADDVFQATFLVLSQSARKIKSGEVLAAWLHGTARNIARRALSNQQHERQRLAQLAAQTLAEKGGEMTTSTDIDPFDELVRRHEQQLLDEELQQLPEASRAPLVLYYLEEKSQAEIAQMMGLTVDAVEGRLRRAKQELRQRLIRRGVLMSTVVAAATVLTPAITAAAPTSALVSATVTTALGTAALGSTALTATAVTGTATSTTLATGATTAAQLAAQEVAAMSAASKATAIFLTTAFSTTVATGLVFGAIAGTLLGGRGTTPVASTSPVDEWVFPMNIVQHEPGPNPFALEGDEPVLLALAGPEGEPPSREEGIVEPKSNNQVEAQAKDISPIAGEKLAQLMKDWDALIAQNKAEVEKWQKAYREEQVEKEQVRDEWARERKELNERVARLIQIVKQLDESRDTSFDTPDGKVTTVDNTNGTVWLDIGRQDGLRTKVTFCIYGKNNKGLARGPKDVKAEIEVVELSETSSIARIVKEDRDRPLAVGDIVFSPEWSTTLKEHYANVGNDDINLDGEIDAKDRLLLKGIMSCAGAEMDLEVTDEGVRVPADAKITVKTKWLVVGELGDPALVANDPVRLGQITALREQHKLLVQEAREHGIKIVSLKDFLTYGGWEPEWQVNLPRANVPFQLKPGNRLPQAPELAQAPAAPAPTAQDAPPAIPESKAKTIAITDPETIVEIQRDEIRLLKFPGVISRADMRFSPVVQADSVKGQADTLRIRSLFDGSCALLVTTSNDTVYTVFVKVGSGRGQFREPDRNDDKVIDALDQQTTVEFPDNTLSEVCDFIAQLNNIQVFMDTEDLKAAGASPDVHVTLITKSLLLSQTLTTLLEKVTEPPLDWYIDNGAIHISTVEAMKKRERLHFYNLRSLTPESQKAAVEYITPLAKAVDNLDGSLGVDASVSAHKRFEEFLQGAARQDSHRPARAIPLKVTTELLSQQPHPPIVLTEPKGEWQANAEKRVWDLLGLRLTQLPVGSQLLANQPYRGGLLVSEVRPASPAKINGIDSGDVLVGLHVSETLAIKNVAFALSHKELVAKPLKFYIVRKGETLCGHFLLGLNGDLKPVDNAANVRANVPLVRGAPPLTPLKAVDESLNAPPGQPASEKPAGAVPQQIESTPAPVDQPLQKDHDSTSSSPIPKLR